MDKEFVVQAERNRMLPHVIVCIACSVGSLELMDYLTDSMLLIFAVFLFVFAVLDIELIAKRNHEITVRGSSVTDVSRLTSKQKTVQLSEVKSVKRGLFGELMLKNEDGKTLVIVYKLMTGYDEFEKYLIENNKEI